jgi:NADPH:quinone reductase
MPLLAADPVIVEPAQREALEALVRAHSTSQQLALRARMILQAADDVGVRESARELDVWPKTVRYWRRRWAEAAARPLTAITAWEALFDRLDVRKAVHGAAKAILIIGGAGGVASVAIQLARRLTDLTVIGTASRPETHEWVRNLGAHHVVDHSEPLAAQVAALGLGVPGFVFSTTNTHKHLGEIVNLIAPQGRFALIDDPSTLDINPFKSKSVSVRWESMFTRSSFGTIDISEQGALLNEVARLVDTGTLRSTIAENFGPINAMNLKRAHALIESGNARGKIVLAGFEGNAG